MEKHLSILAFTNIIINMKNDIPLDILQKNAQRAETMLKILANKNRLLILCNLMEKERNVNELVELVGLSQSALSQHLSKMRELNLVSQRKEGKNIFYFIESLDLKALMSTLYLIYCKN